MDQEEVYSLQNKCDEKVFIRWFSILLVVIGIIVMIVFFTRIGYHFSIATDYGNPDMGVTGQIGDFVGGVVGTLFSLVGVLLLFVTLRNQRESFAKERFETRFFEMIKLHRENVSEMKYTYSKMESGKWKSELELVSHTAESRKVFKVIFSEFEELWNESHHFFDLISEKEIYEENYLAQLKENDTISDRKINLLSYAKIDIIYTIIFFGLSKSGQDTIRKFFQNRYKFNFYEPILKYSSLKPKVESKSWDSWLKLVRNELQERNEIIERWLIALNRGLQPSDRDLYGDGANFIEYKSLFEGNPYTKYYGGHQFRLGHYFRHFFQTVTYINSSNLLNYKEKYENVKLLRGQLSTYEQLVIFLNSISVLGRVWELEKSMSPNKAIEYDRQLITKYNLIKNISNDTIINGVLASDYYPLVAFEGNFHSESKKKRVLLKSSYR